MKGPKIGETFAPESGAGALDEKELDAEANFNLIALGKFARELKVETDELAGPGSTLDGRRHSANTVFTDGWTGMHLV